MNLDQHISELLTSHDCVIVPSFGGFLASYQHATIHPTQHVFSPPSKKIAFNIFLKHNDGLLANHIAGHRKITYTDALQEIGAFVNHFHNELNQGKKMNLGQIGTFYFDKEKNLQFEPSREVNYLLDSYGCSSIQYLPVKRDGRAPHERRHMNISKTQRASERPEKVPLTYSTKPGKKALPVIVVAGAIIWMTLNLYFIAPDKFDFSLLNPFSSKSDIEITKQNTKPVARQEATIQPTIVETTVAVNTAPSEVSVEIPDIKPEETAPASSLVPKAIAAKEDIHYFIIGGAFQYRENADAFVIALRNEGFPEAQILDTTRRLKMVCFNGFTTLEEATKELNRLTAMNKSGWIYSR